MIKKRKIFASRKRTDQPSSQLSPRGKWVRTASYLLLGVEASLAVAAAAALAWTPAVPAAAPPPAAVIATHDLELARLAAAAEPIALAAVLAPVLNGRERLEATVRRGDTLSSVFDRAGVDSIDYHAALIALRDVFDARTLQQGQDIDIFIERAAGDDDARLVGLAFSPDVDHRIGVARQGDGEYRARDFEVPLTRRIARAEGVITESLYADAKAAGAHDLVIAEIASVLAFTVDFQREIRDGDRFEIVFDQYLDPTGAVVKTGAIHYVGFTPNGRPLAFWRYTPPGEDEESGYYDAAGESARRFLMRTPVNATRISSGFSRARRHPILGYTRAHKGTDFAAPTGTPIYAAGAGRVERANVYGSYGNYVRIGHANGYQTVYGHLSSFARGIRAGVRVTQGQVIGYVGMTGGATGPHLHYEVHLDGEAVNPMTIEAPTGRTLTEDELPAFEVEQAIIDAIRARAVPASAPSDVLVAGDPTDHAELVLAQPTDG